MTQRHMSLSPSPEAAAQPAAAPGSALTSSRLDSQGREWGLDLARALAIIGMIAAHTDVWDHPAASITSGFPSALFAVLAGVSVGIIGSYGSWAGGTTALRTRTALWARAAVIGAIGLILASLPHYIAVVLGPIALEIAFLTLCLRLRARTLWIVTAAMVLLTPVLTALSSVLWFFYDILTGVYPLGAWLSYGLVGLLIYRHLVLPASTRRWAYTAAVATIPAAVAIWERTGRWLPGMSSFAGDSAKPVSFSWLGQLPDSYSKSYPKGYPDSELPPGADQDWWLELVLSYLTPTSHSGGLGDVLGSLAVALWVIAVAVLLCQPAALRTLLYPLRALGQLALTSYILHVFITMTLTLVGSVVMAASPDGADPASYGSDSDIYQAIPGLAYEDYQDMVNEAQTWKELRGLEDQAWSDYWDGFSDKDADDATAVEESGWVLGGQLGALILLASLWLLRWRRGPAEALVRAISVRLSRADLVPVSPLAPVSGHAPETPLAPQRLEHGIENGQQDHTARAGNEEERPAHLEPIEEADKAGTGHHHIGGSTDWRSEGTGRSVDHREN